MFIGEPQSLKGNSGKGRRSRELKKIIICAIVCIGIITLYELSGKGAKKRQRKQREKYMSNV